ncbi:MAG: large conductance mechanosensitive channel protein MscL, partial [bacterium]
LVIQLINEARRRFDAQPPATPPAPTREEVLLTEIRDLLARKQG